MARNGYAVYLFNSSEIQWITVAEAFLPPDSWSIPSADPVHRKKIKFDRSKLFEKGKGTVPGNEQKDEVMASEGFTETLIEYPNNENANDSTLVAQVSEDNYPGSPELFSPEGSMCDSDLDKQSENGSRSGRRRSSLADALAEVKNAGYNLFKAGSKSSINESSGDGATVAPSSEDTAPAPPPSANSLDRTNKQFSYSVKSREKNLSFQGF